MDLSRLQELKTKLIHDKDLLPVWGFFLDHFGENDWSSSRLGEQVSHDFLESVSPGAVCRCFPRRDGLQLRLVRLADQQFIHGGVNVAGRFGGVFFFEDVQVGLLAVSDHFPSDETKWRGSRPNPSRSRGRRRGIEGSGDGLDLRGRGQRE